MKPTQLFTFLIISFLLIMSSCSIEKRQYLSGYHIDWKNKKTALENNKPIEKNSFAKIEILEKEITSTETPSTETQTNENTIDESFSASDKAIIIKHNILKNALEECDIIVLKNGEEIRGMVVEIGVSEVKYKKCDNMMGPNYSIKKSDVFMIKYTNGTKDVFKNESYSEQKPNNNYKTKKSLRVNRLALWGFILALVGLFILPIPLGIAGIIMGIFGLVKISKNSEFERGEGFAIFAIIIGLLDLIAGILIAAGVI